MNNNKTELAHSLTPGFNVWASINYSLSVLSSQGQTDLFDYFIKKKDRKVVVEIGTHEGLTAQFLAERCVRVETFDVRDYIMKYKFWYDNNPKRNIDFHLIENDIEKAELLNKMEFDFAFVDGNHGASVVTDFELVKKCGCVLFHDYNNQSPGGIKNYKHVIGLVDGLPRDEVEIKPPFAYWEKK